MQNTWNLANVESGQNLYLKLQNLNHGHSNIFVISGFKWPQVQRSSKQQLISRICFVLYLDFVGSRVFCSYYGLNIIIWKIGLKMKI